MPRDGRGESKHRYLRPKILFDHSDDAVTYGEPYHRNRNDLDVQRYSLVLAEVTDVWSELGMLHKPAIEARRATHEAPRREQ